MSVSTAHFKIKNFSFNVLLCPKKMENDFQLRNQILDFQVCQTEMYGVKDPLCFSEKISCFFSVSELTNDLTILIQVIFV